MVVKKQRKLLVNSEDRAIVYVHDFAIGYDSSCDYESEEIYLAVCFSSLR